MFFNFVSDEYVIRGSLPCQVLPHLQTRPMFPKKFATGKKVLSLTGQWHPIHWRHQVALKDQCQAHQQWFASRWREEGQEALHAATG